MEVPLAQIGNSRGVRLPSALIRKHGFDQGVLLEDRGHEIVLKRKGGSRKLSLEETYKEMVASQEDWTDWEKTSTDGLGDFHWNHPIPKKVQLWAKASTCKDRQKRGHRRKAKVRSRP
jgi:antitoxin MazE